MAAVTVIFLGTLVSTGVSGFYSKIAIVLFLLSLGATVALLSISIFASATALRNRGGHGSRNRAFLIVVASDFLAVATLSLLVAFDIGGWGLALLVNLLGIFFFAALFYWNGALRREVRTSESFRGGGPDQTSRA
jgi:Kef-type K+ transport system membrane component KefB